MENCALPSSANKFASGVDFCALRAVLQSRCTAVRLGTLRCAAAVTYYRNFRGEDRATPLSTGEFLITSTYASYKKKPPNVQQQISNDYTRSNHSNESAVRVVLQSLKQVIAYGCDDG